MPSPRLALSLTLLLLTSVARADDPRLSTEASQAHYDAGRTYFEAGDARRAIVEFRAGQRDDDRPAFDYNLGVCHEKLGDAVRAVAEYRRFLDRAPSDPHHAELEAKIVELERHIGTVKVSTRTPDVHITVDGDATPLTDGALRITAGTHVVSASKDGYLARSTEVVVTGGSTTSIELTLSIAGSREQKRRRNLAIGLGVAGGVVAVGLAVGLGVGLTRPPSPYGGNVAAIVVHP
jgi:tetratricopeptide (TPR) repeat protein